MVYLALRIIKGVFPNYISLGDIRDLIHLFDVFLNLFLNLILECLYSLVSEFSFKLLELFIAHILFNEVKLLFVSGDILFRN